MAITGVVSVSINKEEYSKFETDNAVIEAKIFATGITVASNTNSQLTVELIKARRSRDSVVLTKTVDLDVELGVGATIDNVAIRVNLDTRDAVGTDTINLIRRGGYFVKVYQTADNKETTALVASSSDFDINLITVNRMRRDWAFGLDLQSSDIRTFRFQPRVVTGVSVKEVSRNHSLSLFPLAHHVDGTNHYLSWDNGTMVPITREHKDYMLSASGPSSEYIVIEIDFDRLPTSSGAEELYIEEDRISDTTIRRYISDACDHAENTLIQVYLEPTELVTDTDPSQLTFSGHGGTLVINEDYDFIKSPVSFYPRRPGQWIDIQFPFPSLLKVEQLYGAVANTRVVHVNPEWIEIAEKSGFVQLVPFNTELAFDFVGLIWVESLRSATPIPNFWHYNVISGLRECPGDILELIGRFAAIPILTAAGAAFRGGYSSQSVSRDGVSESVSYTSSAIYGVYSASIEDYRNWIREHLPAIRNRYRGPQMVVM